VLKLNLRKTIRNFIPASLSGAMAQSGVILSRARRRRISRSSETLPFLGDALST